MEDERFRQELDELFILFKKMLDQNKMPELSGINQLLVQQFQIIFDNYETRKEEIARQLRNQFGDSVKEMVHQMVLQLREVVGDDMIYYAEPDTSVQVEIKKPKKTSIDSIEELDEMLKNPDLTEEEINELLDKRHKLSNI